MREIQVNKQPFEDIQIGDTVFKLDVSDAALERYRVQFAGLAESLKNKDSFGGLGDTVKSVVNSLFYGEPFGAFYAECGGKTIEMVKALNAVAGVFKDIMSI